MKNTIRSALVVFLASSSTALAAGGSEAGGLSWLVILFLAFGATIIVFQMIPGLVLFVSMVRGLFSASPKKAAPAVGVKTERNS